MVKLSSVQMLELWDRGARCHSLDRALLLLGSARPGESLEELADVTIGMRDQVLIALRQAIFGRKLSSYIDCPRCRTRLEFVLDTETLRGEVSDSPIEIDGLRVRRPTSRDLAAAISAQDTDQATLLLVQRCGMADGNQLPILSGVQIEKIESVLAEADSAADIVLDFNCEQCGFVWQTSFDIGAYLWREVELYAKALLADIHTLARAYGWSEREVLDLSDARRAAYIEMVTA
ncbi:hypothetical protein C8R32_1165 [Nitrosospira sp. Nsp5]|uniref:Phage baseplate protein n=1 Tax=Nitrosospira multiformis TaxID=1231 RepID=A0ABY0TCK4_9PROT|nr:MULTISPECIES: hypothetical protein [Nitrosospira]PTR05759.1 hypothetical protein C8R32_1165 [Nitrosospira sp. Nsp5]SDQ62265.1 hypothetical protein SAMN05216402_1588 [Nitrosospira multiformis]